MKPNVKIPLKRVPTAAEALHQIDHWADLSERRKRNLKSTLNLLQRVYARPMEAIQLDPADLARTFLGASPARLGIRPSSMTAYHSSMRTILRRLDLIDMPRRQSTPLSEAWTALRAALPDQFLSIQLQVFMAYCSDRAIAPDAVSESTLEDYLNVLRNRRLGGPPITQLRNIIRAWTRAQTLVPDWPRTTLSGPTNDLRYATPLSAFPERFQAEVRAFEASMRAEGRTSLFHADGPPKPLRPDTIRLRLSGIRYAAAALLAQGMAIEDIDGLAVLVQRDHVMRIIDWHWNRAGQRVTDHLGTISDALRIIAKYVVRLPEPELRAVIDATRVGKPPKRTRMAPSRERRLRQFDDPDAEARLLHLPRRIMAEAEQLLVDGHKLEAGWLAGTAVAIAVLLHCPMRVRNLAELRLGVHVVKLDARARHWTHILIDAAEVKNDVGLEWPISRDLASLIETYLARFRVELRHAATDYLFPARDSASSSRRPATLGRAMSDVLHRLAGLSMSPHDFRAFAGFMLLKEDHSAINDLRLILGHKTLETTLAYYASFQPKQAAERHNAMLDQRMARTRLAADVSFAAARGKLLATASHQRDGR